MEAGVLNTYNITSFEFESAMMSHQHTTELQTAIAHMQVINNSNHICTMHIYLCLIYHFTS